jgi:FkbM family methyltransferase
MIYDFIEIGTSDFETLIEVSEGKIGLTIEPLSFYLNNLPNNPTVIKVNCAITNYDGQIKMYYINPTDIIDYQLPDWLKGCNSISKPHPSALTELNNRGLESLMQTKTCECLSWETLIQRYDIQEVNLLKIDTEGHDCEIINSILNTGTVLPKKLHFEANILTDSEIINNTLNKLTDLGYKVILKTDHEIIVEL